MKCIASESIITPSPSKPPYRRKQADLPPNAVSMTVVSASMPYGLRAAADLPQIYNEMFSVRVRNNYHPLLGGSSQICLQMRPI